MKPAHVAVLGALLAVGLVVWLMIESGDTGRTGREAAPSGSNGARNGVDPDRPDDGVRPEAGGLSAKLAVFAPDGSPAGGAEIVLRGPVPRRAAAGRDGRVELDELAPGRYALFARKDRATAALDFELTRTTDLGTLHLAQSVSIRGHVYDARGGPLPHASVEAVIAEPAGALDIAAAVRSLAQPSPVAAFTRTEPDGRYELLVPAGGTYGLRVNAPGFAPETEPARPIAADIDGLDFYLLPGTTVAGTVVDESGLPLAGARVIAANRMRFFVEPADKQETSTAADGTFRLAVDGTDRLTLIVRKMGYALHTESNLRAPAAGLEITLQTGFSLRLQAVRETDPDAPVPDTEILLTYLGAYETTKTDEDGFAHFKHLPTAGRSVFGRQRQVILVAPGFVKKLERLDGKEPVDGLLDLGAIPLEKGGVVTGRVLDKESGAPVAGARVRSVGGLSRQLDWLGAADVETGEDGAYRLEGVPLKASGVLAVHADYVSDMTLISRGPSTAAPLFEPGQHRATKDVRLLRAGTIAGVVVAPDSTPVAGAQVSIRDPRGVFRQMVGGSPSVVFTDGAGRFTLGGLSPRASVPIVATHRDHGASAETSAVPGEGTARLQLTEPLLLTGEVVDAGGAPVPGVKVTARAEQGRRTGPWVPEAGTARPTVTDAKGRYFLRNAPAGAVAVTYAHDGYEELTSKVQLAAGEGTRDLGRTVLRKGLGIEGVVVDADGEPIAGVNVNASVRFNGRRPAAGRAGRLWGRAVTDEQGRFAMFGLGEGRYQVQVETQDSYSERPVVTSGATGVRIVVRPAGAIRGRVVCEGAPVADASVRASLPNPDEGSAGRRDFLGWVRTDADGAFVIERVPPDAPFALRISHDAYRDRTIEGVRAADRVQDFALERGRRVSGLVVDENDRPIGNTRVRILVDGKRVLDVRTDDDGAWDAGGLDPGVITVQLDATGQGFIDTGPVAAAEGDFVRIVARRGFEIRGTVLGAGGGPVTRARVTAVDASGRTVTSTWLRSGSDGVFVLRGLPAGRYTLRASRSGSANRTEIEDVEAGASNVEIRMRD